MNGLCCRLMKRSAQTGNAGEVSIRRGDILEDLRTKRLWRIELAFVANPMKKFNGDVFGPHLIERIKQECLDAQVGSAERRAISDVGDGIPPAVIVEVGRTGDVNPNAWKHFS